MISQFKAHRAKSADPLKSINDVRNLILNFPKEPYADMDTPFLVNWHEHQVKNNNVFTGEITLSMTFSSRRMMDNLVNVHKLTSKRGFVLRPPQPTNRFRLFSSPPPGFFGKKFAISGINIWQIIHIFG